MSKRLFHFGYLKFADIYPCRLSARLGFCSLRLSRTLRLLAILCNPFNSFSLLSELAFAVFAFDGSRLFSKSLSKSFCFGFSVEIVRMFCTYSMRSFGRLPLQHLPSIIVRALSHLNVKRTASFHFGCLGSHRS